MESTKIIARLRNVPARSDWPEVISSVVEKNETKIILLKKFGYPTAECWTERGRPVGLSVELEEFFISSKEWIPINEQLINEKDKPDFLILCKESTDDKKSRVFLEGDNGEVYGRGEDFTSFLAQGTATEVVVYKRGGDLKINEYVVELNETGDCLRIHRHSLYEGKRENYFPSPEFDFRYTIARGEYELEKHNKKEKTPQREKVLVNV